MIFNMNCGGGTGLNFSLVECESENHLPKIAMENTIAIITTTKITSWFLSKTAPETSEEGTVWIKLCTDSDVNFNALNDNGINVHIEFVRQCINGAWILMASYIYQDKWLQFSYGFDGQLFNNGIVNENITGGWDSYDYYSTFTFTNTINASWFNAAAVFGGWAYTNKKVDVTNFSSLNIHYVSQEGNQMLALSTEQDPSSRVAGAYVTKLDISNVTGEYYVVLTNGANTGEFIADKVWLE